MDPLNTELTAGQGVIGRPDLSLLYRSRDVQDFSGRFQASTGHSVRQVADRVVVAAAPKAIFLTGSLPLGMASSGSDIDFVVLVDDKLALQTSEGGRSVNSSQHLAFFNESDVLRAGLFNTVMKGITVEVTVVLTPGLKRIQARLRSRGPELSESEMMIVGRLATGWRLWQSDGYLERQGLVLNDPAFDLYCCTRNFTFALIYRRKAMAALEAVDIPLALHFGRLSVEMVYVSYFASEGLSYLGPKWLAQLGGFRTVGMRVTRGSRRGAFSKSAATSSIRL
jgi:hypothetical protein